MAGGSATTPPSADDHVVQPGEKIWRLIDPKLYIADPNIPNSPKEVVASAFSGDVSALRASLTTKVSESIVDAVLGGKFADWGIAEFDESELRSNGCALKIDLQPEWVSDVHILIVKAPTGNKLNPTIKKCLANLASSRPLRRVPK
jgi:hypothetical protein